MKYRKFVVTTGVIGLALIAGAFSYKKSAGAHPGSTGAPGDNTCAKSGCHVGTPVTYNDTTINQLIFSDPDSTYMPGQTYTVTVRTTNPGVMRFGFELQPLEDSTSKEIGTIVITDSIRTHTLTHSVLGFSRTSVTHSLNGTPALSAGFTEWTFDWTAPPVNEGIITFYYATNSTNNNNAPSGDKIYINIFKIKPNPLSIINEIIDEQNMYVYYDENSNEVFLNYSMKMDKRVSFRIIDGMGRDVVKPTTKMRSKGEHRDELSLRDDISKGIYYINISSGNNSVTKKIFIR